MGSSRAVQLGLLIWKNFKLQQRSKCATVFECFLPLLCAALFVLNRVSFERTGIQDGTHFESFDPGEYETAFFAKVKYQSGFDESSYKQMGTCPSLEGKTWLNEFSGERKPYWGQIVQRNRLWLLYAPNTNQDLVDLVQRIKEKLEEAGRQHELPAASDLSRLIDKPCDQCTTTSLTCVMEPSTFEVKVQGFPEEGPCLGTNCLTNFFLQMNTSIANDYVLPAIVMDKTLALSGDEVRYKLRPTTLSDFDLGISSYNWHEHYQINKFFTENTYQQGISLGGPRSNYKKSKGGTPDYYDRRFLWMQRAVDMEIISRLVSSRNVTAGPVSLQISPYPPYYQDLLMQTLRVMGVFFVILSFMLPVVMTTRRIASEKETGMKEFLKMMGIYGWLHWVSWFIHSLTSCTVTTIILMICFYAPIASYGPVLVDSEGTLVFVFFLLYAISSIAFSFMISTLFSKATSATTGVLILWFLSVGPYTYINSQSDTISFTVRMLSSLLSNTAFGLGFRTLTILEENAIGAKWENLDRVMELDGVSLLHVMLMMLLDTLLYLLVAGYIEAVNPGNFGVPKPFYFPFLPSYWCGTSESPTVAADNNVMAMNGGKDAKRFEQEPVGIAAGIYIQGLTKRYPKNTAVDNLKMSLFEGQITALLGHNGAGKTTTMSMLTGLIPPTSGTAKVHGFDIRRDLFKAQQHLGLCAQHNILFQQLTVREHFQFFAKLKDIKAEIVNAEIDHWLQILGIFDKADTQSRLLSGGQKRKVCVGIALIGGSKIVILDEPTSGLDPSSRRVIWDILQNERAGRTILLTTHFMDEADYLGDRIAIMVKGKLECVGSSMFLKKRYGAGYHLVMVKEEICNVQEISSIIEKYCPTATVEETVGAQLSYILSEQDTKSFEPLLGELQMKEKKLGISSFGLSVTTMEEVFLRVGEEGTDGKDDCEDEESLINYGSTTGVVRVNTASDDVNCNSVTALHQNLEKNTGLRLFAQQFRALFVKRALNSYRHRTMVFGQLIFPILFIYLAIQSVKSMAGALSLNNEPALQLDLNMYFRTAHTSFSGNANEWIEATAKQQGSTTNYVSSDMEQYLFDVGKRDNSIYTQQYQVAPILLTNVTPPMAHVFFNNQPYHNPAIAINFLDSTLLKYYKENEKAKIVTVNHPLPNPDAAIYDSIIGMFQSIIDGILISLMMIIAMSLLTTSFIHFLIKERDSQAKLLQYIGGANATVFWLATLCWDYINYIFVLAILIVLFPAFGVEQVQGVRIGYMIILMLSYGWAILPSIYMASFIFKGPATGYATVACINVILGLVCTNTQTVLGFVEATADAAVYMDYVFAILLPNYAMGQGVTTLFFNYGYEKQCTSSFRPQIDCAQATANYVCCPETCERIECLTYQPNYLSWNKAGIGRYIVFLLLSGMLYWGLVALFESVLFKKGINCCANVRGNVWRKFQEDELSKEQQIQDEDVREEKERVHGMPLQELVSKNSLVVKDLSKFYGFLTAVNRINFTVGQGSCFGLLGINGAGKTSTFKMLTGELASDHGAAYLDGYSTSDELRQVRSRIGYCPQFDALVDRLTGREMLVLFARLRGIPEQHINAIINHYMDSLDFGEHKNKCVEEYSGGNKRKLSTALAMIGDPPVIFLDEPSTGMDPASRRKFWTVVSAIQQSGRSIILTSHSMEECEALCSRLAIMVNGEFKCLGATQHLKSKFGQGYTLLIKLSLGGTDEQYVQVQRYVTEKFPGSILRDAHQGYLHYHIVNTSIGWAQLFGALEKMKETFQLQDYSISQTTLEQVFLSFARKQREDERLETHN